MKTALLCGAILALAGSAAHAQYAPDPAGPGRTAPPPSDQPPAAADRGAADASTTASAFQPGMIVKDATGETVGTIQRVGQTPDGVAAVIVDVDGRPVNLAASVLTPSSDGANAVSSLTKSQIKAGSSPR